MQKVKIYKVHNHFYTESYGPYVMDSHPAILNEAESVLELDGVFVPFNDGMMINCLAVQNHGKIALLFAKGNPFNEYIYKSVDCTFRYERIHFYANMDYADDVAYAVGYIHDDRWEVIKIDCSKEDTTVSIVEKLVEGDKFTNPTDRIPASHRYGFGMCPFASTPERINSLAPNEVFVYGSNKEGRNIGGAARVAAERFGAIPGVGVGRTGQAYAIPTMDGSIDLIREYVEGFRCYAFCHPELTFYVTRIGCGIAGWKDEQIAPLFNFGFGHTLANVILPKGWENL